MDNFDDKYKKKSPFSVPEGYFDGLTDQVMERIDKGEKPQKTRLVQMLKPYLGLAAIFLLALLVMQIVVPSLDKNKMLIKDGDQVAQQQASASENEVIFDSQFNPTSEEIIEYLASEVDSYELVYAGIY